MRAIALLAVLLAASLPSANAQPSNSHELLRLDGAGDVSWRGQSGGPVAAPSNAATDPFDLISLRVHGEDMEGLHVEVKVRNLRTSTGYEWGNHKYSVEFRLEASTVSYYLEWGAMEYSRLDGNDTPTLGTRFCVRSQGEVYGCNRQRSMGGADYAQNALNAYIPKRSLMGLDPVQSGRNIESPVLLGPGSSLAQFVVRAWGDSHVFEDRLPDAGTVGPFLMQHPAANGRVAVSMPKSNETAARAGYGDYYFPSVGDFPRVSVQPGNSTRIEVVVANQNGAKRLLHLSAAFDDPSAKNRFEVRLAPSVQVPGNESRIVNLVVVTGDRVAHRESVILRVRAVSAGYPDEVGALTVRLVSSAPLSVAQPTYYLHGRRMNQDAAIQAYCSTPIPFFGGCSDELWLNTLESDPLGKADKDGYRTFIEWWGQQFGARYTFPADTNLIRDVVLDPRAPVEAKFKVRTNNVAGSLEFGLQAGARSLGQVTVPVPAGTSGTQEVAVTFLPLADAARIPAGSEVRIHVMLRFPVHAFAAPPALVGEGSFVRLPVIADPNAPFEAPVALGDAFLGMSVKGDHEEFMNPGKSKAYRIVLVNEGNLTDDVRVLANITAGECGAAVRPGDRFRLEAGDSVRLDVLVRVPDEAKEGSQCRTEATAVSGIDPAFKVRLLLTTIATRGAEFEDEAANYTADEDTKRKLRSADGGGSTPGVGFVALAVAAVAIALGRRRLHP